MPARKKDVKTYSNGNKSCNRSRMDIIHNIFANPIQKKKVGRKPKIEIKKLPPRLVKNTSPLDNSSLKMNYDNTFDKLLNATDFNKISYKPVFKKNNSNSHSTSEIKIATCTYSPLRLRKTRKQQIKDTAKFLRSPIMTRSLSRNSNDTSNINSKMKRTLERPVNESLYIEKEVKINIREPTFNFTINSMEKSLCLEQVRDCNKENSITNSSYEHIFSDTFKQKYNNCNISHIRFLNSAISSTPVKSVTTEKLINETISPISKVSIPKLETQCTPRLRRINNNEILKLPYNEDISIQNENEFIHTTNYNKSYKLKNPLLNRNSCDTVAVYNKNRHKNMSKLFTPVVNITSSSNLALLIKNSKRNTGKSVSFCVKGSHVNTRNLIANLTNSNLELLSKSESIRNDFPILNMKHAFVNITLADIENFLNRTHIDSVDNIKPNLCKSLQTVWQPIVNLTNIDIDNFLKTKNNSDEIDFDSESFSVSTDHSSSKYTSNLTLIDNPNETNNIYLENNIINSEINDDTKFIKELLINLTNINVDVFTNTGRLGNGTNLDDSNSSCMDRHKILSIEKNSQGSLSDTTRIESFNDSMNVLNDLGLNHITAKLGTYVTLRNRPIFRKSLVKRNTNRSKDSTRSTTSSKSVHSNSSTSFGMQPETSENINDSSVIAYIGSVTDSKCSHKNDVALTGTQNPFYDLEEGQTSYGPYSLSDQNLNPASVQQNIFNKIEQADVSKNNDNQSNFENVANPNVSLRFSGFDDKEIAESSEKYQKIKDKLATTEGKCRLELVHIGSTRESKNKIRKSLFHADYNSEVLKNPSPDLFDDFEMSKVNYSFLQSTKLNSPMAEASRSTIASNNIISCNNSSVIESSYTDLVDKSKKSWIFSLKKSKRNRISKFEQSTKIMYTINRQNLLKSPIFLLDVTTPAKVTKRQKVYYTPVTYFNTTIDTTLCLPNLEQQELSCDKEDIEIISSPIINRHKISKSNVQNIENCEEIHATPKKSVQAIPATFEVTQSEISKDRNRSRVSKTNLFNKENSVGIHAKPKKSIEAKAPLPQKNIEKTKCVLKENSENRITDAKTSSLIQEQLNEYSLNISGKSRISKTRKSNRRGNLEVHVEKNTYKQPSTLNKPEVLNSLGVETKENSRNDNKIAQDMREVVFAVPKLPSVKTRGKTKQDEELVLKPGKLWRRSFLEVRNSKIGASQFRQSINRDVHKGDTNDTRPDRQNKIIDNTPPRRLSVRVVPLPSQQEATDKKNTTVLENYAVSCRQSFITNVLQEKSLLEECFENLSLNRENSLVQLEDDSYTHQEVTVTARDVVFRKCGQTEPLPFEKCYPNSTLQHCQKIGEGVYGEVFLFRRPKGGTTVMKVIPIEGDLIVNGERQKKFEEILSEITIAMELSSLRNNMKNYTKGFAELYKVTCVKGKYPARLIELWELFDELRRSENDHPDIFDEDQLYVVLELANAGDDMESFVFNNAQQAYALVTQVACALAVAESSLEFEHRDLHWGNVLVSHVSKQDTISFCLDGQKVTLDTQGIHASVIDFTMSRMSYDGVCIYNDLSLDPDLFTATGDYQFELYRLMRKQNGNEWQHFEPYTNILWLHYLLDKTISGVRYKYKNTKVHKTYIKKLITLKDEVLEYKNVEDFVNANFINDIYKEIK